MLPRMSELSAAAARGRLLAILLERSLHFGRFRLASGGESDYYVDVRKTSFDPEGAALIARLLAERTRLGQVGGPTAVGGPTLGADPIVTALGLEAWRLGRKVDCFVVRKEAKDHGAGNRVEGNLAPGASVLLVDDVLTRGGSLAAALPAVLDAGGKVATIACVVDRQAGGRERFAGEGYTVVALFTIEELLRAAGRPATA
jgi:orotate phosphoribosyltransferase